MLETYEPVSTDPSPEDAAITAIGRAAPPLKAIRHHCLDCCLGSSSEVDQCASKRCPMWLYRFGRGPTPAEVEAVAEVVTHPQEDPTTQADLMTLPTARAIRRRCLDCAGFSVAGVKACAMTTCALYPYRMGKGTRNLSEATRAALSQRMATVRAGLSGTAC